MQSVIMLKQGILFFWSVWLTLVLLSNLCDLLKCLGVLSREWKFASGNYAQMRKTTAIYRVPETIDLLLFAGVLVWQAAAALLMWNATLTFDGTAIDAVYAAFGVSLALWAAFMVADEICVAYEVELTHSRIVIALLVSLLAVDLL